jgi:imidazolonepropionase-like amidohydrolase
MSPRSPLEPVSAGHSHPVGCVCTQPVLRRITHRLEQDLSRRASQGGASEVTAAFALPQGPTRVRPQTSDRPVLLTNLRLFDGRAAELREGVSVLLRGNRIQALVGAGEAVAEAWRLDCGGRTVMPGLIDVHWHATLAGISQTAALTADSGYVHLKAALEAERTLLRGFTTVRDVGGPAFALKRAIDEGVTAGPRIFPSGAMISQTSGHGDFRRRYELPRTGLTPPTRAESLGAAIIADGADEVLRRTREQLMLGASQIKLLAGGGVTSSYDPLDTVQYSEAEIRAAVAAASDWGTYVTVHVYTARGIQRAVASGVQCIEHGQLTDEETVRLLADRGVWWSLQPFLDDEDANSYPDAERQAALRQVSQGTERAYTLARKHGVRLGFGTDILFSAEGASRQGAHLAKLTRWFEPIDVLRQATSRNAELLKLSGPRAPYDGALGVIEPGAFADLLVVDGDPSQDVSLLAQPERTLRVIIKDGKLYKNTL